MTFKVVMEKHCFLYFHSYSITFYTCFKNIKKNKDNPKEHILRLPPFGFGLANGCLIFAYLNNHHKNQFNKETVVLLMQNLIVCMSK